MIEIRAAGTAIVGFEFPLIYLPSVSGTLVAKFQVRDYSHVIDGAFVASDGDDRIDVSYPYDGEV